MNASEITAMRRRESRRAGPGAAAAIPPALLAPRCVLRVRARAVASRRAAHRHGAGAPNPAFDTAGVFIAGLYTAGL